MGNSKGSFLDPKTLKCGMKYLAFLKGDSTVGCIFMIDNLPKCNTGFKGHLDYDYNFLIK